jgi:drug/metabolite transporter (DMT)-like permease
MFLAVLCFSCANFFVKTLSLYFDSFQILLFRAIPMLLISFFLIKRQKLNPFGNKKVLLVIRSLICVFSIILYYKSFKMLDIGAAVSLRYLAPVFSIFVALIILKNKLHPINIITSILAISSVVLICTFSS